MDRAVSALLAALIVLSSAGAVVGVSPPGGDVRATTPVDGVAANTTDVLVQDDIGAATFARGDVVVTGALAAQTGALAERYTRERFAATLRAADSGDAKREVVHNATAEADRRTTQLLAAEREARSAYLAGDLSAESYLSTLGRLHVRAVALEETVRAIEGVDAVPVDRTRTQRLRADLQMLQGPVRERLADALAGGGPSARIFVAAAERGVSLSVLEGDEYVRESVRTDNRDEAVGDLGFDDAETRFGELYPWASTNKQRISMGALGADVYVVEYTHTHGTIDAWLDASTNQVYREVQHKTLSAMPVAETRWTQAENVTVGVSHTYPGGPVRVSVTNATDAPVPDAQVSVNGTDVGTTGEDGAVWTVSPAGEYPVTVSTADVRIQVMVDPASDAIRASDSTTEG